MRIAGLLELPPALQWSHNDYYHPVLLRHVPSAARRALDVGCGAGQFARLLAERVGHVDAIDRSSEALTLARQRSATAPNVRYVENDLFEFDADPACYDFISLIAVLHHMEFAAAAKRLREMLAPGGVLAVLGICRDDSMRDYARSAVVYPLNALVGVSYAVRRAAGATIRIPTGRNIVEFPVRDPAMTFRQVADEASTHLPGAVVRRQLFWRYLLVYRS